MCIRDRNEINTKRQETELQIFKAAQELLEQEPERLEDRVMLPVSYTHLDVYKRQAVKSIVSTPLADAIAAHYGVEMRSVLTGFKLSLIHILPARSATVRATRRMRSWARAERPKAS